MGMTEEFEASLQVLRGFDTDISIEVNEIKVNATSLQINWFYNFTLFPVVKRSQPFDIHNFRLELLKYIIIYSTYLGNYLFK